MTQQEVRDYIESQGYESVSVFDEFAEAFIGMSTDDRAVYDYDRMVQCLVESDGISEEDAIDYIEYNTIRALPYIPNHPVIVHKTTEQ